MKIEVKTPTHKETFSNVLNYSLYINKTIFVYFYSGDIDKIELKNVQSVRIIKETEFLVVSNSKSQVIETIELPFIGYPKVTDYVQPTLAERLKELALKQPDKCVLISFIKS